MTIIALQHIQIALPVGGEDEARAFYCDLLGLSEVPKPDSLKGRGGFWTQTGDLHVHFGADPDFTPARKAHPAFEVADLGTIRDGLEKAGNSTGGAEPIPGFERFYVDDPFGNRIEIMMQI